MKGKVAAALAVVYVVWGSTYFAIRVAIETLPPLLMASARFVAAGALLILWERLRGAELPRFEHWRTAIVSGGLLLLGGNGVVCWAEQRMPSGTTSLFIATVPLWMVSLDAVATRRWPGAQILTGLVVGFLGLVLLVGPGAGAGSARPDPVAALGLVLASLSWAVGSLYARRAPRHPSHLMAAGMQMLAGGALLAVAGMILGEGARVNLAALSANSVAALAYLILFGSILAYTCYAWLLENTSPALVSTYAFVNPVVAVVIGSGFGGEPLTGRMMLAAAVIIVGVSLIIAPRLVPQRR